MIKKNLGIIKVDGHSFPWRRSTILKSHGQPDCRIETCIVSVFEVPNTGTMHY